MSRDAAWPVQGLLRHFRDDFVRGLAQIGKAVRVAGRQRHEQQVGARFDRALRALEIRHQHGSEESRQCLRIRQHLRGVGQLRQQPRRHERADFDLALSRGVGIAHPFELARSRQDGGDALQAVAQADFANHDLRRQ